MRTEIYKSITDIDEKKWNEIVKKNHLICTYSYLRAIEESNINDCRYYYTVIYEDDKIIAHAAAYFITTELDAFAQGPIKNIVNMVRTVWKNFFILRTVECGTPVALGSTISFGKDTDKKKALRLLCRSIEKQAKMLRVNIILFRDFYTEELKLFDELKNLGYTRIWNLPSTRLEIKWKSFDEYLDSMRSQYKYKIKQRVKKYNKSITTELVRNFSASAKELEKLWTNVYDNAKEYKREKLKRPFFENIDRYLQKGSAVLIAKKDNLPIGFSLLLFDDETLTPLFFGLDYNYNKEYNVYFNLMYKAVEVAINEGKRDVDMGITTLIPKKDIGCEPVTLNMYMKHFNPFLNMIVPRAFALMTPQDRTDHRRVFNTNEA